MSNIELFEELRIAEKRKSHDNARRRKKRGCCNVSPINFPLEHQIANLSTKSSSSSSPTSSEESYSNEASNNFESDDLNDFLQDELLSIDNIEFEDLQPSLKTSKDPPSHCLHYYTELKTVDFCRSLLLFIRKCNLSKTHVKDLLDVIHTALPQPNFLPKTFSNLVEMVSSKFSPFLLFD